MARLSPPATRNYTEPTINLATGRGVAHVEWDTYSTLPARSPSAGAAMHDLAPQREPSRLISPQLVDNSTASTTAPGLIRDIRSSSSNDVYALPGQVNLATGSNSGHGFESVRAPYGYTSELSPPCDQPCYQQYAAMTPVNYSGGAEIPTSGASPSFAYTYAPSPNPLTTGGGVPEHEQVSSLDNFQQALDGPLLETQVLNELYIDGSQRDSLRFEHTPQDSYGLPIVRLGREESQDGTQHVRHPFSLFSTPFGFMGGHVVDEQDAWSSAAFSSPSIASYHSSPYSMMNDASVVAAPAPALDFEDIYSRHSEPPLSRRPSSLQNFSSNSSPGPDSSFNAPLKRERRGAISQQGNSHSVDVSKHPMLDASVADHIYADTFELDGRQFSDEDSSTPSLSPSTHLEPDFPPVATASLTAPRGQDVIEPGARMESQDRPALKLGEHRSAPASTPSAGPSRTRYHPYGRTTRMTEHEQVIRFDNGSAADLSDGREAPRRSAKKSRGSKRCYCTYVCPVKHERCDQSVSREADLGRHLSKHKAAEAEMVAAGLLAPERATHFGELKPTGAAICEGCGTAMSRKDALKRHLRKAGKACQAYYPDVVL